MATTLPLLQIDQGTDRVLDAPVTGPDGQPYEITGIPLRWLAKRTWNDDDEDAVLTKTTANGGISIGTPVGDLLATVASIAIREVDTTPDTIKIPDAQKSITLHCSIKSYETGSHEILVSHDLQINRTGVLSTTVP